MRGAFRCFQRCEQLAMNPAKSAVRHQYDDITGPINLGNPKEMSVETIAREILACTRSNSSLQFRPLPQDDPKRRQPVIAAAEKRLGWQPRVTFKDGLEATIAYFALQLAGHAAASAVIQAAGGTSSRRLTLASQR